MLGVGVLIRIIRLCPPDTQKALFRTLQADDKRITIRAKRFTAALI